ncbi:glycine dehydrogenase (decarboxylating) alpha subunit [Candidatus Koribacter versatilis Ellin345]|uniref:Probable glycine dehydrogenase (decarboxylating) subunit 1 n=1 Tax=Koribacter versatilis (strain Ellin345) TaxID=204669 RepID=GCSPA_KORVE|nr:aminomethyl-transferring glycine dehydrogenase subunit GcvPA [Candidatus Koribacter versatilis]Q1INU0.1 RecName: Full=Probable glycine dehydrogenase (decarboxylating) subunit 1; AltName: Full=Glycine cleavage system P-protein subunit 1; AltName: Full=Glycine decarboxylase subunit 1; AltName: Full=Glycine dehydrogenase (aminomethyl-transferring) subunit 1 [Candidatus Koribacter versatilis Ellin345]ABF41460.1 glycine dehydrogenase (decarboxylating) alpha subunit [Candidatus Koribacter versatilis
MRYLPKSQSDRDQMLRELGCATIDDLFAPIPAEYRLTRDLAIPRQYGESEILDFFKQRASENANGYSIFIGAGAYNHYRPVVIDSLISRGEWFTAYTPYQPEISQGTLQAIFEFQSMICELTGMEVANASMYDGSTGAAEAIMMAVRLTGRHSAIIANTVHPEYREVIATYAQHQGLPISHVGYNAETGRVDIKALEAAITDQTAAVLIQSPNFFGTIEDVAAIADLVHKKGALLVVSISEALSLGLIKPPSEADIISMESQSFGVPLGYGGPYVGVIATKEKFVRQIPGRLCGQTVDRNGKRGFVLTLSTREQHIRREKATSNICTNQALIALIASIFMTVYGKQGLRELAKQNLAKTAYAVSAFEKAGAKVLFKNSPFFNEFVVQTKSDSRELNDKLISDKIIGGFPLKKFYPELGNSAVWCVTELNAKAAIDAAAKGVAQ